jgi:enoyl-[acyl-carrier protein] reductase III
MVKEFESHSYWTLILGGSSGLGLASAFKLARHGMNICIVHRNGRAEAEAIEKEFTRIRETGIKLLTFNTDVIKTESRKRIVKTLKDELGATGRVRCLLHSIAKGNLKPLVPTDRQGLEGQDFALTIENMAVSLSDWTREIFLEGMFADDARVLSFTSEGSSKAWQGYAAVASAKSALESISRSIASEYAPYGIRSNCIQAGVTDTQSLQRIPGSESLIENSIKRNPFNRLTTPEDVANVVYLLCRDEAAWINGSIIPVNGGEHIH